MDAAATPTPDTPRGEDVPADPRAAVLAGETPEAAVAALNARGETLDVDAGGVSLRWRRFGRGRPLVLLHGGHGSWLHWARNIGAWSQDRAVLVPDLPGYGESGRPADASFEALLQALQASLDALVGPHTAVDLAGFSFGGLVAAQLAARRGRVGHRILLGPAGHGGTRRPQGELRSWREVLGEPAALEATMRHNLSLHLFADAAGIDPLALRIHTQACLQTRFHSRTTSRGGGLVGALDRVDGPVLLIWGEHDVTAVPDEVAASMTVGRPERQAVVVPDAGHWVAYEAAGTVNRLVRERLAGGC